MLHSLLHTHVDTLTFGLSAAPCHCSYDIIHNQNSHGPYKYTREAFLQFPTLAGESPKWSILVVIMGTCDFPEIGALSLRLCPRARANISGKSLMPMLQLLHVTLSHLRSKEPSGVHILCTVAKLAGLHMNCSMGSNYYTEGNIGGANSKLNCIRQNKLWRIQAQSQ